MDESRGVVFALLAAKLRRLSPPFIAQLQDAKPSDWRSEVVQRGYLSDDEADALETVAEETLRVCGHDVDAVATLLDADELHRRITGAPDSGDLPSPDSPTLPMAYDAMGGSDEELVQLLEEAPGRYRHVSRQGRGGMGQVLLVHDTNAGRDIALKELLPEAGESSSGPDSPVRSTTRLAARFLQEACITARLEHPNIVPVYELGRRSSGKLFYTMRLVRGTTLSKSIATRESLQKRLKLLSSFRDLCYAIAYAHSRGVLHRDIKPSNIMVGAFGETVVLDWGVAKLKHGTDLFEGAIRDTRADIQLDPGAWQSTEYGTAVGTPQYMPPEQAEGRHDDVAEQSDVYSLGVVLYEILTGRAPFRSKSLHAILEQVVSGAYTPVNEVEPDAPPELVSICEKAMQLDPDDRYGSAMELAEEIERWQDGLLVRAYEYRFVELAARYYRKRRALVNLAAGATAIVLAVAVYAYWSVMLSRDREREQRIAAQHEAYGAGMLLAQQHIEDYNFGAARKVLASAEPSLRHWEWGYLSAACAQDRLTLRVSSGYVFDVRFALGGSAVVTVDTEGNVQLWNTADGALRYTWPHPPGSIRTLCVNKKGTRAILSTLTAVPHVLNLEKPGEATRLARQDAPLAYAEFSADGRLAVLANERGGISLLNLEDGRVEQQIAGPKLKLWRALLSPDKTHLLVWSVDDSLRLYGVKDGALLQTHGGRRQAWSPDSRRFAFTLGNNAFVVDLDTGATTQISGHSGVVGHARFSPDGALVLTASEDRTARLWDAATGAARGVFDLGARVDDAHVSPDGNLVLAYSKLGPIQVWSRETQEPVVSLAGHGRALAIAGFSPDSQSAVTCSMDGSAKLWDLRTPALFQPLGDSVEEVFKCAFSPGVPRLAAASVDGVVQVSAAGPSQPEWQFASRGPEWGSAAAFDVSGKLLLTASDAFTPAVLDADTGQLVTLLRPHAGSVWAAAFHPQGNAAATAAWDGVVRVWDARTGELLRKSASLNSSPTGVAFSPSGDWIAVCTRFGQTVVWDWEQDTRVQEFSLSGRARHVAFTPDGARLAVSGGHGDTVVWDLATQEIVLSLDAHQGGARMAGVSPDNRRIVTVGEDRAARIWDAQKGDLLARLDLGPNRAQWAGFSDAGVLYTANAEGPMALRRWRTIPWDATAGPGPEPAADWFDAQLDAFRKSRVGAGEPPEEAPPAKRVHLTTPERVAKGLEALGGWVQSNKSGPLIVEPGADALLLSGLGLRPGYYLDSSTIKHEEIFALLERQKLGGTSKDSFELDVLAEGQRLRIETLAAPLALEQVAIEISRDDLLKHADKLLQYLSRGNLGIPEINERNIQRLVGLPKPPAGAEIGVWLNAPLADAAREWFVALGLAPRDEICRFDGADVHSIAELRSAVRVLRKRINTDEDTSPCIIAVRRGEFVERSITIRVQP